VGGRIVDLLSTPHLATEALLPWLLNDTLTSAERSQVEAHLRSCAQCSAELAQQKQLQSHYSGAATPDPALDIDAAFARLLPRLDDQPVRSPRRPLWRPRQPVRWWQLGLAVQMGVILALGSALLLQLKPTTQNEDVAAYRGLAATAQRATGDALVVFDPNASETQMRATLQRFGARIVDGPTAAGAFVVRFDDDPTAAMLVSLRSDPAIVRVESLSAQLR
jgi:anti-sigma factor RsiW